MPYRFGIYTGVLEKQVSTPKYLFGIFYLYHYLAHTFCFSTTPTRSSDFQHCLPKVRFLQLAVYSSIYPTLSAFSSNPPSTLQASAQSAILWTPFLELRVSLGYQAILFFVDNPFRMKLRQLSNAVVD
ncbi:hypothetical protein BGAL_0382g00030 [Botrytis galanthina]|uniref:Uncharacterized protein n=1 Tax=Botrytis galanthina TaxID=278940 RepID=A0A4S8QSV9_9HELO|nr:hypothetical protein BGAL_0382g00030 [Botrytis galanthina]